MSSLDIPFLTPYSETMYSYFQSDNEEEIKHGEDEDAELKYEERLVAAGMLEMTTAEMEAKKAKQAMDMVLILCSCGSPKCFAIRTFGLPKPTWEADIQPIGCQMTRDKTALRIKAA